MSAPSLKMSVASLLGCKADNPTDDSVTMANVSDQLGRTNTFQYVCYAHELLISPLVPLPWTALWSVNRLSFSWGCQAGPSIGYMVPAEKKRHMEYRRMRVEFTEKTANSSVGRKRRKTAHP